jgi:hypothetical protein
MTIHRRIATFGLGGNYFTWWLLETMLDAGWTIVMSGSGTGGIYSATTDVFSHSGINPVVGGDVTDIGIGAGSEHWGNGACWAVIEAPSGRQLLIHRTTTTGSSSDNDWHYGWADKGDYTGGDTDTPPTTATGVDIWGTISSWPALSQIGGSSNLVYIAADDTASPAGEYGVFAVEFVATNTVTALFMLDDFRNVPAGREHSIGVHIYGSALPFSRNVLSSLTASACYTWYLRDETGEVWDNVSYLYAYGASTQIYPGGGGVSRGDNKEYGMRPPVGFVTEGYIGQSRWVLWPGLSRGYPNSANSKQHLYINDALVLDLLDGTTAPLTI